MGSQKMRGRRAITGFFALFFVLVCNPRVHADPASDSITLKILALCDTCQVIILGERHGQAESPLLFLNLVKKLLSQGEKLFVGLEIKDSRQDALDAALEGRATPVGIAHSIIDSVYYQDMLRALSQLQNTANYRMTVVAIDNLDAGNNLTRDQAMAITVKAHLSTGLYDRAVILVGNFHSILKMRWDKESFRKTPFLAELLASSGLQVKNVMQQLDFPCNRFRQPTFHPITDKEGLAAARSQLEAIKAAPDIDAGSVTDAVVVWQCPNLEEKKQ